jgi:hypothetical protein
MSLKSPVLKPEVAADEAPEVEAEYTLESPAQCPTCRTGIRSVYAVRLLRTKVNFTSSLPRRGYVVVCPACRAVVPAAVGGILG